MCLENGSKRYGLLRVPARRGRVCRLPVRAYLFHIILFVLSSMADMQTASRTNIIDYFAKFVKLPSRPSSMRLPIALKADMAILFALLTNEDKPSGTVATLKTSNEPGCTRETFLVLQFEWRPLESLAGRPRSV